MLWLRWSWKPLRERATVNGHESAWPTDLAGAHIPDNTKPHFRATKSCRDDGTSSFDNKLPCDNTLKWRTKFQNSANRLAGGNCPQFTCSIWPDKSRREMPTIQMKRPTNINWSRQFLSAPGHWTWQVRQQMPAMLGVSQTKSRTEVLKRREHPCRSMHQSNPFCPWHKMTIDLSLICLTSINTQNQHVQEVAMIQQFKIFPFAHCWCILKSHRQSKSDRPMPNQNNELPTKNNQSVAIVMFSELERTRSNWFSEKRCSTTSLFAFVDFWQTESCC